MLTLACRLPVRPLLNLHVVPGASDDVLVLKGGVRRDVEGIPGLHESDLWAVLGLLVNLEHHHALVQVDVLKKPGADGEKEGGEVRGRISSCFNWLFGHLEAAEWAENTTSDILSLYKVVLVNMLAPDKCLSNILLLVVFYLGSIWLFSC